MRKQTKTEKIIELEGVIYRLRLERKLLAMLAADTPQFYNPMHVAAAKELRDKILAEKESSDAGR